MDNRRSARQVVRGVGWVPGHSVVQLQENFNTAGSFVLNLETRWEPGDGQWLGTLEKAGSRTVVLVEPAGRAMGLAKDVSYCRR